MSPFITCEDVTLAFPLNRKRGQSPSVSKLNLNLKAGDRLGLVGANGAGKSSILRLLAGIYTPTHGRIISQGKIGFIGDISAGLMPDLSGYENINLLISYWNIPPQQTQAAVDDVLTFSGLEEHLDKPVSTYSAGMRMRLAFTVATFSKPDILLVDEVIGVGDAAFKEQSKVRITTQNENAILVLASHSVDFMLTFCTLGAVIVDGEAVFLGDIRDALDFQKNNAASN